MAYILCLIALYVCSILIMIFMHKFKNTKLTNLIFCLTVFVLYIICVIIVYLKAGFNDWNFQNSLPVANVSPFMFSVVPLYFVLPKKAKSYFMLLIALLSVGMFLSPTFSCIFNAMRNYKFHVSFMLDYVAHFALCLWGVYIIKSKQAELKIKDSIFSGSIIVCVAIVMLIINIIFDTAFFGLNLNGKHSIYNMVLVSNSYLSALLYFVGLISVLVMGFLFNKLLNLKRSKKDNTEGIKKEL